MKNFLQVPCSYQGGKQRIASQIVDNLIEASNSSNSFFYDLCCGSGAISIELVNSSHHQSLKKVPESFHVNAFSIDGVIEGIESKENSYVLGVQWHPESLFAYMEEDFPHSKKLFSSFIESSCLYAELKR